jgi:hypothetical protein
VGCNNPVEVLIKEAIREFKPEAKISCIVSIGTGMPRVSAVDAPGYFQKAFPSKLIDALKDIATSSERVSNVVEARLRKFDGLLHRLNVNRGLEDIYLEEWDNLPDVKTHTSQYLGIHAVGQNIDKIVAALLGIQEAPSEGEGKGKRNGPYL